MSRIPLEHLCREHRLELPFSFQKCLGKKNTKRKLEHHYLSKTQGGSLTFIFLLLRRGAKALPRQGSGDEVHEDVAQGFHVVPPTLLDTQVGVDGGVAGGAGQVLVFPVGNVLVAAGVPVLLGQAEVDDVDEVAFFAEAPFDGKKNKNSKKNVKCIFPPFFMLT